MSLRRFLQEMEKKQKVVHVRERVSPRFEIPSIIKAFDQNGPTLFFDNIENHETKVVSNVCRTRERIYNTSSVQKETLHHRLVETWNSPSRPKIVECAR